MSDLELFGRIAQEDFIQYRNKYEKYNDALKRTLLYHAGMGAGLYSELGGVLEAVAYCYENKIAFKMYADDANFSENGWTDFFEIFCKLSHNSLNKKANYRYKAYRRVKGIAVPNLLLRRIVYPCILKKMERTDYLCQDLFQKIVSRKWHLSKVNYPLFGMNGKLHDEYAKMATLCLRYNEKTADEIVRLIKSVNLPEKFTSIQIRGGDKTLELQTICSEEFFLDILEKNCPNEKNFFVFSDDYRKIAYLKRKRPDWNIYTLTKESEKGYYNEQFNKLSGIQKRNDIIKVFAMVEICIASEMHIGCRHACVNNYIKSARKVRHANYMEYMLGESRPSDIKNKLLRILGK